MKIYVEDSEKCTRYNLGKEAGIAKFINRYGQDTFEFVLAIRQAKLKKLILTFDLSKADPANAFIIIDVGYCVDKESGRYKHVYPIYRKVNGNWPNVSREEFLSEVRQLINKDTEGKMLKIAGIRKGVRFMNYFKEYMDTHV